MTKPSGFWTEGPAELLKAALAERDAELPALYEALRKETDPAAKKALWERVAEVKERYEELRKAAEYGLF